MISDLPITTLPTRPGFYAWMDTENVYIYQTTEQSMKPRMIPLTAPIICSVAGLYTSAPGAAAKGRKK